MSLSAPKPQLNNDATSAELSPMVAVDFVLVASSS
jgi:hypothetical protein